MLGLICMCAVPSSPVASHLAPFQVKFDPTSTVIPNTDDLSPQLRERHRG